MAKKNNTPEVDLKEMEAITALISLPKKIPAPLKVSSITVIDQETKEVVIQIDPAKINVEALVITPLKFYLDSAAGLLRITGRELLKGKLTLKARVFSSAIFVPRG